MSDLNQPDWKPEIVYQAAGDIHVASGPEVEEIADELLRNFGDRKAVIAATMGTQQRLVELETVIRKRYEYEEIERNRRQGETDQYRVQMDARLDRIEAALSRSLIGSAVALLVGIGAWIRGK